MALIELDNVRFSYDGKTPALDGISMTVEEGEFLCVLGANGSGKSTLAKHMNALLAPSEGCVCVGGIDTAEPSRAFEVRQQVSMVFQNPDDQIVASIAEDEVAFGPENLGLPPNEIRERVTAALERVGLTGFEKREVATLSGGQKQRLAIAGALAMRPKVLVLDEASAMLDPRGRASLLKLCCELNEAGLTIVMITHYVDEAVRAKRVIVLDSGHIALDGTPEETLSQTDELDRLSLESPLASRMAQELHKLGVNVPTTIHLDELENALCNLVPGRFSKAELAAEPAQLAAESPSEMEQKTPVGRDELIAFQDVTFSYGKAKQKGSRHRRYARETEAENTSWSLGPLSFSVADGEFLGIAGHTGSGKSTLIQLVNGLIRPTSGSVSVRGKNLADKSAAIEARREIGLAFQYPEQQLFAATVFDDVAFGPRNLGLSESEVGQRVRDALELVHLDVDSIGQSSPFALSGGQQRRVAFAGILAMRPSTLVLDEPAAGLDPRERSSFLSLIREFHTERGLTIIMVSHDMSALDRLCDRILVLDVGTPFAFGSPSSVFANSDALRSIGLDVPEEYHLAQALGLKPQADMHSLAQSIATMLEPNVPAR